MIPHERVEYSELLSETVLVSDSMSARQGGGCSVISAQFEPYRLPLGLQF